MRRFRSAAVDRLLARQAEKHVAELRRNQPVLDEFRSAVQRLTARMAAEGGDQPCTP